MEARLSGGFATACLKGRGGRRRQGVLDAGRIARAAAPFGFGFQR